MSWRCTSYNCNQTSAGRDYTSNLIGMRNDWYISVLEFPSNVNLKSQLSSMPQEIWISASSKGKNGLAVQVQMCYFGQAIFLQSQADVLGADCKTSRLKSHGKIPQSRPYYALNKEELSTLEQKCRKTEMIGVSTSGVHDYNCSTEAPLSLKRKVMGVTKSTKKSSLLSCLPVLREGASY